MGNKVIEAVDAAWQEDFLRALGHGLVGFLDLLVGSKIVPFQ